jgi:hypothetical protein
MYHLYALDLAMEVLFPAKPPTTNNPTTNNQQPTTALPQNSQFDSPFEANEVFAPKVRLTFEIDAPYKECADPMVGKVELIARKVKTQ